MKGRHAGVIPNDRLLYGANDMTGAQRVQMDDSPAQGVYGITNLITTCLINTDLCRRKMCCRRAARR